MCCQYCCHDCRQHLPPTLWTTVEYRPSAQTASDGPGRCAYYYYYYYGSEGLVPAARPIRQSTEKLTVTRGYLRIPPDLRANRSGPGYRVLPSKGSPRG